MEEQLESAGYVRPKKRARLPNKSSLRPHTLATMAVPPPPATPSGTPLKHHPLVRPQKMNLSKLSEWHLRP